ncbi:hypothetical protein ACHAQJ_005401 [Trichoderma viride]
MELWWARRKLKPPFLIFPQRRRPLDPQQWRRAHRFEAFTGLYHDHLLDPTAHARRHHHHRRAIAVGATIRHLRRVRLDPDRDQSRRLLVAMDATGVAVETGAVIAWRDYRKTSTRTIFMKYLANLDVSRILICRLTELVSYTQSRSELPLFNHERCFLTYVGRAIVGTNRGTAYILYDHEADAEAAIAHMHEAQVDGAVINVSIVLQRRKLSPAPPTARRGANIDPRVPFQSSRGGGPPSGPMGGSGGGGGGGGRRRLSPSSRYGPRSDVYRPNSLSPARSPGGAPQPRGGGGGGGAGAGGRYRSRSNDSFSSRSRSRSPGPRRRGGGGGGNGGGRRDDYDTRRRSRSRSFDGERNYR